MGLLCGFSNKGPYPPLVLQTRRLGSRWCSPPGGLGWGPSCFFQFLGLQGSLGLWPIPLISAFIFMRLVPCVCVSLLLCLMRNSLIGSRASHTQDDLTSTSLNAFLFPDTVLFTCSGGKHLLGPPFNPLKVKISQLCPTLCSIMGYSLPDSSVREILRTRILEWVAFSFSRGSSQPRDQTQVSYIAGRFFTV